MLFEIVKLVVVGADEHLVADGSVHGLGRGHDITYDSVEGPFREDLIHLVLIFLDEDVLVQRTFGLLVNLRREILCPEEYSFDSQSF